MNTKNTQQIVCPHCYHVHDDSSDRGDYLTGACNNCNKEFYICKNIKVTFTTIKKEVDI